ncbi:hypothetical protein AtNW77_Chr3g0205381 [Arabidopsis thaliana]
MERCVLFVFAAVLSLSDIRVRTPDRSYQIKPLTPFPYSFPLFLLVFFFLNPLCFLIPIDPKGVFFLSLNVHGRGLLSSFLLWLKPNGPIFYPQLPNINKYTTDYSL